ncbi:MAG: GNAT family N-acetyltransferase [Deltaproteobacteria bacterium]|nr:GNAT family N-acetyltransferase [Deltaproteobacteria bacterium]
MPLSIELVDNLDALEALAPAWETVARLGGDGAFFRGPAWLLPWYRAHATPLGAQPHVLAAWHGSELVGLAPFYSRTVRMGPGVKSRELRLFGDAGPRPPSLDLVVLPGFEERFALAVASWLAASERPWDVLDLQPLRDPSRARAYLAERLNSAGRKVESHEAGTVLTIALAAPGMPDIPVESLPEGSLFCSCGDDPVALEKGLVAQRRLSRLEWATRDEASPIAHVETARLLGEIAASLGPKGTARLSRLDERGETIAAAFVIDDPPRAACVALAADPQLEGGRKLLLLEARAAAERGLRSLDIVVGPVDIEPPPLPFTTRRTLRLRAFNATKVGTLARTYATIKRRADAAREAPGAASSAARAAWSKIREAAAQVATYERLHLYRGELWTRGIQVPAGLAVAELAEADFDALAAEERSEIVVRLELDEGYCREKWRRGDLVVLARLNGRPAGIAWCARRAVFVPEIGREVRPGPLECYIHDVFVAPEARGKSVAPAMLEDLARRLRQRDVYRAWALIQPPNVASTRAFEKAAYASVADVVYARMAAVDKIVLRPPDPEGKKLLGIP